MRKTLMTERLKEITDKRLERERREYDEYNIYCLNGSYCTEDKWYDDYQDYIDEMINSYKNEIFNIREDCAGMNEYCLGGGVGVWYDLPRCVGDLLCSVEKWYDQKDFGQKDLGVAAISRVHDILNTLKDENTDQIKNDILGDFRILMNKYERVLMNGMYHPVDFTSPWGMPKLNRVSWI